MCFRIRYTVSYLVSVPVSTGGRQVLRGVAQYGTTPVDSAKTEVTMRFPVKNCYSKVIVSESLEIFWKYYYYYYIRKYT